MYENMCQLRIRYGSEKRTKKAMRFLRGISHEYGFVTDPKRISDSNTMYEEASALRIRNGSEWHTGYVHKPVSHKSTVC